MLPVLYSSSPLARPAVRPANRLAALFDQFFRDDFFGPPAPSNWAAMPLSVWHDEDRVYVEMDAPGLTPDDIELAVHDGALTIQGERRSDDRAALYDGRCYGRFCQRVALPAPVDSDGVEATLASGVLKVTLPKTPESKPKKIAVRGGE